jgi:hypothetical protein
VQADPTSNEVQGTRGRLMVAGVRVWGPGCRVWGLRATGSVRVPSDVTGMWGMQ